MLRLHEPEVILVRASNFLRVLNRRSGPHGVTGYSGLDLMRLGTRPIWARPFKGIHPPYPGANNPCGRDPPVCRGDHCRAPVNVPVHTKPRTTIIIEFVQKRLTRAWAEG